MENKLRASFGAVLIAVVILALGHDRPRTESRESHPAAAKGSEDEPISCFKGAVYTAKKDGAVAFHVRCRPIDDSETVSFQIAVSRRNGKVGPLKSFRKHPVLRSGQDGKRKYGVCYRDHHDPTWTVDCEANVENSSLITGRIWVGDEDVCGLNIGLISWPKAKPCRGVCAADYVVVVLANGPPRGC